MNITLTVQTEFKSTQFLTFKESLHLRQNRQFDTYAMPVEISKLSSIYKKCLKLKKAMCNTLFFYKVRKEKKVVKIRLKVKLKI